jgi:hypothetical protein
MLCDSIGALGSENDTAGFELPIPSGGFETTDCYSVEHERREDTGWRSSVSSFLFDHFVTSNGDRS